MKNLLRCSFLLLLVLLLFGCEFPLNKKTLLAAKHIDLTADERAFIKFRQVFAQKARNYHFHILNNTTPYWPLHLKSEDTLKSLINLVAGNQRKASASELREILNGDEEWLGKAFVLLLRMYMHDREDDLNPDHWWTGLPAILSCLAHIDTGVEQSLKSLSRDALKCVNQLSSDAMRMRFVALSGFLLDDAYLQGRIDTSLEQYYFSP